MRLLAVAAAIGCSALGLSAGGATAQQVVTYVNDEPITSMDVTMRQRFLALTAGGMNDAMKERMQARFKAPSIQADFVAFIKEKGVKSQEEANAAKKEFVQHIQQQVQSEVMGSATAAKRQAALQQLIDERIMLQAAKELKIIISDEEVNQVLTGMAQGGSKKLSLQEFLDQFSKQGISPTTLRESTRAKVAWRQVVRRVYGSRVQSAAIPVAGAKATADEGAIFDLQLISVSLPSGGDQQAVAKRRAQAEMLRQRFDGCAKTGELAKLVDGTTVKALSKVKLSALPGDARAIVGRAEPGRMTPPVIAEGAIQSYVVCNKRADPKQQTAASADGEEDKRQQEFRIYSERHLKDLKDKARIDTPKSG